MNRATPIPSRRAGTLAVALIVILAVIWILGMSGVIHLPLAVVWILPLTWLVIGATVVLWEARLFSTS